MNDLFNKRRNIRSYIFMINMLKLVRSMAVSNNCSISAIEGNIACGKSFILDYISSKKNSNIYCKQEPVAEWTHMKTGTDLLKLFYQENERWSFAFENMVQLSRLKTFHDSKKFIESFDSSQNNELNKEVKHRVFVERSIFSSFNVFALNSYEEKRLNQIEFDILDNYYKFFLKKSYKNVNNINSILNVTNQNSENEMKLHTSPSYTNTSKSRGIPFQIIYIRTDPDVCYDRLKKRDRSSEVTISLDYLRNIHIKYEKWVDSLKENDQTNLKIINGNLSKEMVLAQVDEIINE